jgi:hypothetical protein
MYKPVLDLSTPRARVVAVVGVCASGKTVLASGLRAAGYLARQVSQEHSYVPAMWQRITRPDVLIYLDAQLETIRERRHDPEWPGWIRDLQIERLRHARAHCELYIETDHLTPQEVLDMVLIYLARLDRD